MMPPAPSLPESKPVTPQEVRALERYHIEFPDRSFVSGPRGRWQELKSLFSIMADFLRGFRTFHFAGPCVTVFGSARVKEGHPYYDLTRQVGAAIAELGFTVMTGGGPGLMEAANRGAREAEGRSVGINIILPFEQKPNAYLDKYVDMKYFFTRKTLLIKYSYAFVVMPGGLGTMDELFEALTLIQTGKIKEFPVILMGTAYWQPVVQTLYQMRDEGMINHADLDLLLITDSVPDAMQCLRDKAIKQFNLRRVKVPKPMPLIGEHSV
jgi:uncharacterized protein (TIGR00730 family)